MVRDKHMARRRELPELELACLRILWMSGDQTVHEVRERLRSTRQLAYTTVMTVLDRMSRKGAVSRRKVGRAHMYHAEIPREDARERAVERLLEVYFDGSRDSLITFLETTEPGSESTGAYSSFDEALL